jgi:hypothetical protein
MAVKRVIEGVHVVPMGMANAFLIEGRQPSSGRSAGLAVRQTNSST